MTLKHLATAVLLLAACQNVNSLSGSMSEEFPLDVSYVNVYRNDQAIQVNFLLNRNIYLDVVARVTVALIIPDGGVNPKDGGVDIPFEGGMDLNVAGEYAPGHPICSVVHAPGGEPVRSLPPVLRGDFHLSGGGDPGQLTSGDFSFVFDDSPLPDGGASPGDIGFGRTLVGNFSAIAIDAGFGPLP
jgi:hypothetical protein